MRFASALVFLLCTLTSCASTQKAETQKKSRTGEVTAEAAAKAAKAAEAEENAGALIASSADRPEPPPQLVELAVVAGTVILGERQITDAELVEHIRGLAAQDGAVVVNLKPDSQTGPVRTEAIVDLAKAAGAALVHEGAHGEP